MPVQAVVVQVVENASSILDVVIVDALNNYAEATLGRSVFVDQQVVLKVPHIVQVRRISLCRQLHLQQECQDQLKTVVVVTVVAAVMVDMLYSQVAVDLVHFLTQQVRIAAQQALAA